jgi:hypothetical protein
MCGGKKSRTSRDTIVLLVEVLELTLDTAGIIASLSLMSFAKENRHTSRRCMFFEHVIVAS